MADPYQCPPHALSSCPHLPLAHQRAPFPSIPLPSSLLPSSTPDQDALATGPRGMAVPSSQMALLSSQGCWHPHPVLVGHAFSGMASPLRGAANTVVTPARSKMRRTLVQACKRKYQLLARVRMATGKASLCAGDALHVPVLASLPLLRVLPLPGPCPW